MAFLDKFRAGAQKAAIQATAFAKDSSSKVASGSRDFVQGFSLPGEAEKAAKILDSFLGMNSRFNQHIMAHMHVISRPRPTRVCPKCHTKGCFAERER
jgi:hypothetical protein